MSNRTRLLKVLQYLRENTNEQHCANAETIIEYLQQQGIAAERKTIYSDIRELNQAGYDIELQHDGYYFNDELFETAELRILADYVKASSFLTEKKSRALNKKLLSLTNRHDRLLVDQGLYDHSSALNESILYSINEIMKAINRHRLITFSYFDLDTNDRKVYRSKNYLLQPYSLIVNRNRYYLIGCNPRYDSFSSYRLDKMDGVRILEESFEPVSFDINDYMHRNFSMYNGQMKNITLKCANELYQEVREQFGDELIVTKRSKDHFIGNGNVQLSPTFFSWLFAFGGRIVIVSPEEVKNEFIEACRKMIEMQTVEM